METLENQIIGLQAKIADSRFYSQPYVKTQPVLNALAQSERDLEMAFERWEHLESIKNGN